jgi:hypothetical protein
MTSGVTNAGLMDTLGMTVEPALFVLALWALRRHPVAFGLVATLGFHVREFVAYAVAASVVVDVIEGRLPSRDGWRDWAITGVAMLGTSAVLSGMARLASPRGPGTWVSTAGDNLTTLGGAFCFAPAQAAANIIDLGQSYLGLLWGASPAPFSAAAVQSQVVQGMPWAWPAFAAVLLLACARVTWRWRAALARRHDPVLQLGVFLLLVGLQSVVVYAISRCGPLSLLTVRYALLGVFLPTGLALVVWAVEPRVGIRRAVGAAFVALALLNAWPHVALWREQWTRPTLTNRAALAAALESRGISYVRTDYWTAYYVAFMTRERVTVVPDILSRVEIYERRLAHHEHEAVRVSTRPCGNAAAVVPGYYLCQNGTP